MIPMLAMFYMTFDQAHAVYALTVFWNTKVQKSSSGSITCEGESQRSCGAFWVRITW
jgi:hypothetical protein